jgi:hypothetical protein
VAADVDEDVVAAALLEVVAAALLELLLLLLLEPQAAMAPAVRATAVAPSNQR